jgi:undecaprenyl-diphosphatase
MRPLLASIGSSDRHAFSWVVHHRLHALDPIFVGLSYLGTAGTVWVALAILVVWRKRHRLAAIATAAAAVWGADALASLVKLLVGRTRPCKGLLHVHTLVACPGSASLPSGHTTTAFAGAAVLVWLAPPLAPAFATLTAAVAFSRIYVGVHYPTDVAAGALLGTTVAFAAITATRALLRSGRLPFGAATPVGGRRASGHRLSGRER